MTNNGNKRHKAKIVKVANIQDGLTGEAFDHYRFRKIDGRSGSCVVKRAISQDPRAFCNELLNRNAVLPSDKASALELLKIAANQRPQRLLVAAAHLGWLQSLNGYVLSDHIIGTAALEAGVVPPLDLGGQKYGSAVELSVDQDKLRTWAAAATLASRQSSVVTLCLAAAFAAPLCKLMNHPPFTIVVYGPSKTGKSTGALLAASTMDYEAEPSLHNWKATRASVDELGSICNDRLLVLNELALADQRATKQGHPIQLFAYEYGEGVQLRRHGKSSYAVAKEQARACGIALTNSEKSVDALALKAGAPRSPGEFARLCDVPAVLDGAQSIFNRPPNDCKDVRAWSEARCKELRDMVLEHHNLAFPAYIEFLLDKTPAAVRKTVERCMREFAFRVEGEVSSPELRHASRNFGLLYAGAFLAQEAKLLKREPKYLLKDVVACFRASMRSTMTGERFLSTALVSLIQGLEGLELAERKDVTSINKSFVGYTWEAAMGKASRRFAVKMDVFKSWFASDALCKRALRWLHDNHILILRGDAAPEAHGFNLTEVNRPGKVGDKTFRAVQFADPRPLARKHGHHWR